MQIGEKNFLPGKEETRRNPDGFQEFLTQPDEKFSVKMRAGAYWYSFLLSEASGGGPQGRISWPPAPWQTE
jgi:hypothetical protein